MLAKARLLHLVFAPLSRTTMLSNVSEEEMRMFDLDTDVLMNKILMFIPPYQITSDLIIMLHNIKYMAKLNLRRARGGFERTMLSTQIISRKFEAVPPEKEKKRRGLLRWLPL